MNRLVVFGLPVVLVSVLIAGCSSSTSGTGSTAAAGRTSRGPSSSSAPTRSGSAPTEQQLVGALLSRADVPSDWTSTPNPSDNSIDPDQTKVAQCLGIPDSQTEQFATASSDEYDQGNSSITSNATSFPSASIVQTDLRGLLSSKAPDCFKQRFIASSATELPGGSKVEDFTLQFTPGPNGGPSDVAATMHGTIPVVTNGVTVTLNVSVAYIAHNLVEAEIDFIGVDTPIPAATQRTAIDAVANRVLAL